jgi:ubiquinone/menaquinone biosynthesis C-methylase UbiE
VNLDLFHYGKWRNFTIGEAHHLPFRNSVFDRVCSKHCVEHLENPFEFFRETKRILKEGGTLECTYPTDTKLTKKTIHNLLNLRWSSAFKWKKKLMGKENINYGGHKWQMRDAAVSELLREAGFKKVAFTKISFPSIRMDLDPKIRQWKVILNRYLPTWQIETRFVAET